MDSTAETQIPMLTTIKEQKTQRLHQYLAAISVSLGTLCAGTTLAWTSPALAQLSHDTNSTNMTEILNNTSSFKLTEKEGASIGSILTIGALVSAIPVGYLADKIGRKAVVLGISVAFFLNWLLILCAQNAITIVIGRVFAGIGAGASFVTAPMYIGEISEPSIRGILGSFIQMSVSIGILFTCIVGSLTTWWNLTLVLIFIPIIFGIIFVFMPESPAYLVKKDRLGEAEKTLQRLRGSEYDVTSELKIIEKEVKEAQRNSAGVTEVFTSKANRRAFAAVVGVLAFQQLCGINAVVFYTVPIFKAAGSGLAPDLVGILVALVQVVASYISILIIEKANRKFYLMISSAGMMLFLAGLGMYFHLKKLDVDLGNLGFLPITCAVLFMTFFCVGYGPVPWMLLGEIFSPEIKGIASGFAILTNWLSAFLVTFGFPLINAAVGAHVSFYILALIMAAATIYVYFLVPETRGKTFLEIQNMLNR